MFTSRQAALGDSGTPFSADKWKENWETIVKTTARAQIGTFSGVAENIRVYTERGDAASLQLVEDTKASRDFPIMVDELKKTMRRIVSHFVPLKVRDIVQAEKNYYAEANQAWMEIRALLVTVLGDSEVVAFPENLGKAIRQQRTRLGLIQSSGQQGGGRQGAAGGRRQQREGGAQGKGAPEESAPDAVEEADDELPTDVDLVPPPPITDDIVYEDPSIVDRLRYSITDHPILWGGGALIVVGGIAWLLLRKKE